MSEQLKEYRKVLVEAEQDSQDSYDKTLVALSGGGLGISLTFVKDFINGATIICKPALLGAWFSWGLSLLLLLTSFYSSHSALQNAIKQVDEKTIWTKPLGGRANVLTRALNAADGLLFLIGLAFMIYFVYVNQGH